MSCFFVTGTDTNVGKTVASRAIMQALSQLNINIVGYKPVAFCAEETLYTTAEPCVALETDYASEDNADVLTLINSASTKIHYREANSYTFQQITPIFSEQGKQIQINKLNRDLAYLTSQYPMVLVEGHYGWLTPINKHYFFADWVQEQKIPVVLVVGIKEGCINHALLTVESIQQRGLRLLGWVANRVNPCLSHYAEIIELLTEKIDAPLLGKIPYLYKPEEQQLAEYIDNITYLTQLTMTE